MPETNSKSQMTIAEENKMVASILVDLAFIIHDADENIEMQVKTFLENLKTYNKHALNAVAQRLESEQ